MKTQEIIKVDKTDISNFKFATVDVYSEEYDKTERWHQLNYGMVLGNIHKLPVKITFQDDNERIYRTEATIWSVTEKNIILKNNTLVPIRSIIECVA